MDLRVSISHWFPIISFCPINKLPDLLYATITFEGSEFKELYEVRNRIKKIASWKLKFMEDIAIDLHNEFPDAIEVKLKLITGRHTIISRGLN